MTSIDVENEFFSCRQEDDVAVIKPMKGAKNVFTKIDLKEDMMSVFESIRASKDIKGVAIVYSDQYTGHAEHKRMLLESIETKQFEDPAQFTIAFIQFLEIIREYQKPIIGGLNGGIGPDSFGMSLALDLRIATNNAIFHNPNLQLGIPPFPLLSFFFVQSLGSPKATELLLTKSEISSNEAFDLRLIHQVVSPEDLESVCLQKVRDLSAIPGHTLVEMRRLLQPGMKEIRSHIDEVFKSAKKIVYRMTHESK